MTYFIIVVDDNTVQLAATANGSAIDLTSKPAAETHSLSSPGRGYLYNNLWIRNKDEAQTDTGFILINDSNGTVRDQLLSNIYVRGFGTGFNFGATRAVLARNLFAANCTTGLNCTGEGNQLNDIDGVFLRDCVTGIASGSNGITKIGSVVFENVTTFYNPGGGSGRGMTVKNPSSWVRWEHTGSGAENVALFPAASTGRFMGKIRVHSLRSGNPADNALYIAEIKWDGSSLTITDSTSRHTGGASASTLQVVSDNLEFRLSLGTARTMSTYWDFDGYYYTE